MISNLSKNRIFQNINLDRQEIHGAVMWFSMTEFIPETDYPPTTNETGRSWGRIQNMDPRSMDHPCGLGPWNPSWTRSMDYPRGTTSPPPPPPHPSFCKFNTLYKHSDRTRVSEKSGQPRTLNLKLTT